MTQTEREVCFETPIVQFLEWYYKFSFKVTGNTAVCKEHNSLKIWDIQNKGWSWWSKHLSSRGCYTFLRDVEGLSAEDIFNVLGDYNGISNKNTERHKPKPPEPKQEQDEPPKQFLLPPKGNLKTAIDYLVHKRGLSAEMLRPFHEHNPPLIYADQKGNVCFVGYDNNGVARYCFSRSCERNPNFAKYRKFEDGSDKKYPFKYVCPDPVTMYLYESPIDLFSHYKLQLKLNQKFNQHFIRVETGGCKPKMGCIENLLTLYPTITAVVVCYDNDTAGNNGADIVNTIVKQFNSQVKVFRLSPQSKDWNEDLLNLLQKEAYENGE
jgi:hypothetical protein